MGDGLAQVWKQKRRRITAPLASGIIANVRTTCQEEVVRLCPFYLEHRRGLLHSTSPPTSVTLGRGCQWPITFGAASALTLPELQVACALSTCCEYYVYSYPG